MALNGIHQLLVYADNINILGVMNTVQKNTAHLEASREGGVEINTEKTKYVVMSHYQNAGQIRIYLLIVSALKMCRSSNISEQL
jgi:hypothetical protein